MKHNNPNPIATTWLFTGASEPPIFDDLWEMGIPAKCHHLLYSVEEEEDEDDESEFEDDEEEIFDYYVEFLFPMSQLTLKRILENVSGWVEQGFAPPKTFPCYTLPKSDEYFLLKENAGFHWSEAVANLDELAKKFETELRAIKKRSAEQAELDSIDSASRKSPTGPDSGSSSDPSSAKALVLPKIGVTKAPVVPAVTISVPKHRALTETETTVLACMAVFPTGATVIDLVNVLSTRHIVKNIINRSLYDMEKIKVVKTTQAWNDAGKKGKPKWVPSESPL
jgi:hypothetical protein